MQQLPVQGSEQCKKYKAFSINKKCKVILVQAVNSRKDRFDEFGRLKREYMNPNRI